MNGLKCAVWVVLGSLLATPALAATRVWTGAGPDANWSTPANWAGGIAPVPGDDLEFPTGAARLTSTNDFPAGTFFGNLRFGSRRFAVVGNAFTLGGDVVVGQPDNVVPEIPAWTTFITVPVTLAQAGTPVLHLLDVHENHRLVFGAPISGGANAHLLKRGRSIVEFDTANTYLGPAFIESGTLAVHDVNSLGSPMAPTHIGDATLLFVLPGTGTVHEPLDIERSRDDNRVLFNVVQVGGGRLILAGDVNIADAASFDGSDFELSGRLLGKLAYLLGATTTLSGGPNTIQQIVAWRLIATRPDAIPDSASVSARPWEVASFDERVEHCVGTVRLTGTVLGFRTGSCNVSGFGQVFVTNGRWQPFESAEFGGRITLQNSELRALGFGRFGADQVVIDSDSTLSGGRVRNAVVKGRILAGELYERAEISGSVETALGHKLNVYGTLELQQPELVLRVEQIPLVGSSFVLIDNRGTEPVMGTFANLPEGSVTTRGGVDFRISYRGGSGNDVTLTAVGFSRYFSEGVNSALFSTRFALFNPHESDVDVTFRFLRSDRVEVSHTLPIPPRTRRTLETRDLGSLANTSFATRVESTGQLFVERTTIWAEGRGAHAEAGVPELSRSWYFAEGVTNSAMNLFYLVLNVHDEPATVVFEFQRPSPLAPVLKTYVVAPRSRATVWVNQADPALASTEVAAAVRSDLPTLVERSLYANTSYGLFDAGHSSVGTPTTSRRWDFVEGAVGETFDTYLLVSNPGGNAATVTLSGRADVRSPLDTNNRIAEFTVAPHSRLSIDLDQTPLGRVLIRDLIPRPRDVGVSLVLDSTQPIVAERAMWWGSTSREWRGTHSSSGFTSPSRKFHVLVDGEEGGPLNAATYLVGAEGAIEVYLEDGRHLQRSVSATYSFENRVSVSMLALFPELAGQRYSVVVQGLAERSTYFSPGGESLAAGVSVKGTPLF